MVQIVRKSSQRQDEKPGNGDGIRVIYGRMVWSSYRPNVSGDENDDGDRAEPGVSDREDNVTGDVGSGEIFQGAGDHAQS